MSNRRRVDLKEAVVQLNQQYKKALAENAGLRRLAQKLSEELANARDKTPPITDVPVGEGDAAL